MKKKFSFIRKIILLQMVICIPTISLAQKIAAGSFHPIGVCTDSTRMDWGYNLDGQLGIGSTTDSSIIPVAVNSLTGINEVAAGNWHSLALKNDGTVWACGYNLYGSLGNGNNISSNVLVQVSSITAVRAIACSGFHSLA